MSNAFPYQLSLSADHRPAELPNQEVASAGHRRPRPALHKIVQSLSQLLRAWLLLPGCALAATLPRHTATALLIAVDDIKLEYQLSRSNAFYGALSGHHTRPHHRRPNH